MNIQTPSESPHRNRRGRIESKRAWGSFGLTLPATILLGILFVFPLGRLLLLSVAGGTLEWYQKVFENGLYTAVLLRTVNVAIAVTFTCLILGYPVAYFLANTSKFWRQIGFGIVVLPLWTSALVNAYAWMSILGRNGLINRAFLALHLVDQPITLLNTKIAVVLGLTHVMLPFMILPLYAAVRSIDKDLPQAARSLGASVGDVFLYVYLPLTRNGILAGATLTFVLSLGYYIVPAILGGGKVAMIATIIEAEIRQFLNWNFGAALSAVLVFTTIAAVAALNYTNRDRGRSDRVGLS